MYFKKIITVLISIFLVFSTIYGDGVTNNDGSSFITKAEFDALKSSFQSQIDNYNQSIDNKIDNAIASYLGGIRLSSERTKNIIYSNFSKVKCITKTEDLSFTPGMPEVSTIVWEISNDNKGNTAFDSSTNRDIVMFTFYGNTASGKSQKEKRYLVDDYDGAKSGAIQYKWYGLTNSALTTLSLFNNYTWGNPDSSQSHANFYNAWPILTSLIDGVGSKKYTSETFKTANLNENARVYLKRNDGGTSGNLNYEVVTPISSINVVSIAYNDDTGNSDINTDLIITFSERNLIAGVYSHPEWVYTDANSISGTTFVGNISWIRRHKFAGSSYVDKVYAGARTMSYYNNSGKTRDNLCSFGMMPAISTNLIKLGEKTTVSIEDEKIINNVTLDENTINDGFPLLAEPKDREVTWEVAFEDTSKDYYVWFKMDPFVSGHSGDGEPDESTCFEVSCDGTKGKKSIVKDGKATFKWKMPKDGVVYIKWSEADTIAIGGGVLDLNKCNSYVVKVEDK